MKPAYHINLTTRQKRLIAEIAAIQSQIEWLMRITIQHLLSVSPKTAQRLAGSTVLSTNAEIWLNIVREKHPSGEAREWAEFAYVKAGRLAQGRNDFIHTLYGIEGNETTGPTAFPLGNTKFTAAHLASQRAVRVSNSRHVNLETITIVRNDAAYLSLITAHIEWLVNPSAREPSPWRRKLSKVHLLQFQKEEQQRASVRERQRATSPK